MDAVTDELAPSRRLSLARLIAFAGPTAPAAAVDTPLSVYLPAFYASLGGLSLTTIGLLVFAVRAAEIPIALCLGMASDRFGPARNRRKAWVTLAVPVVLIGIWKLFVPPPAPGGAYLLGWLLVAVVGAVMLSINHVAWGAEIAADYRDRTRVQAARQVASVAGLVLVLVPPILIERAHPADTERLRMSGIALFFLALVPVTVGCAALFAPERPSLPKASGLSARPLRDAWHVLAEDRALRRLIAAILCDAGGFGVVTSLFVFLARDVWDLGRMSSLLLLAYLLSGVVGLGPILRLARRQPKSRTLCWLALGLASLLPTILFVPSGGVGWAAACVLLLGAPSATNTALFDSMTADLSAAEATATSQPRAGLYFALQLIVGRLGRGIAAGACFGLLQLIGFHPHQGNTAAALTGFRLLYVAVPMVLQLAIAALMWRFPEPSPAPGKTRSLS
ncbi:MAG: MFS transporter [Phenylobacterium sp.]